MLRTLTDHWWTWLVRGILAIIFGLVAFTQPGVTALTLVFAFGLYAIAEGLLIIWAAFRGDTDGRIWYILAGLVSILAGVLAFARPGLTWLTLVWLIGIWAIVTGVLQIVAAIRLREELSGEVWLIVAGVLSVIAGLILVSQPGIAGLSLVFVIGAYAILFGISLIALSFRLKGLGDTRPARAG